MGNSIKSKAKGIRFKLFFEKMESEPKQHFKKRYNFPRP